MLTSLRNFGRHSLETRMLAQTLDGSITIKEEDDDDDDDDDRLNRWYR
jgi:hypothetical protein